MVLEKTLESPLDCKESNQSILKEISPGCSLEELMLKLKLQYFGHLISFLDFDLILGEGRLVENYIYHCYSCLDSSALWTLNFTMYYELCNPKVHVVLPNWRSESQGAIYPYE